MSSTAPPPEPSGPDQVQIPGSSTPPPPMQSPPPPGVPGPALASIGQRVGSQLLWAAILLVAYLVVGLIGKGSLALGIALYLAVLAFALSQWHQLGVTGVTVDRRIVGIKVVDASTGEPIGLKRASVRQLVLGATSALTCGIGLIVLAVVTSNDPRRQGWHDKAAKSVVVVAGGEPGLTPTPLATSASSPGVPGASIGPLTTPPPPPSGVISGAPGDLPTSAEPLIASVPWETARPDLTELHDVEQGPVQAEIDERTRAVKRMTPIPAPIGWSFVADDGQSFEVLGLTIVGRDPAPGAGDDGAVLRPISDPAKSLSKTHAAFGLDEDAVWVEDRNSTNGVSITRDGVVTELAAGIRTGLVAGDRLMLGDWAIVLGAS
jgi:uncharacterized RDD family membrane protein YckC